MTRSALACLLLFAAAPGPVLEECALPAALKRVPDLPFPRGSRLEAGLCNRLVNTILLGDHVLKTPTTDARRAERLGNVARRLYAYGYFAEARELFLRVEKLAPEDFRFPFMLGMLVDEQGQSEIALQYLEKARGLQPDHAPLLALLARVRLGNGDSDGASAAAERALELEPDLAYGVWAHAEVALARRDFESALRSADRLLELDPEASLGQRLRAKALTALAREEAAGAAAELAGDRPPVLRGPWVDSVRQFSFEPLSDARFGRAVLRRGEELTLAIELLERALTENPEDTQSAYHLGRALRLQGNPAAAIEPLERATELTDRPEVWLELGRVREESGALADAAAAYRTVLDLDPGNKMARFWLARTLAGQGAVEPAVELLDALLADGFGASGYQLAASLARQEDRDQDARDLLRRGLEPRSANKPLNRALVRLLATSDDADVHDPDQALELARKLTTDDVSTQDQAALAFALAAVGDRAAAAAALEKALAGLSPEELAADQELEELSGLLADTDP